MLKLYKEIQGKLHYWEAWEKNEKAGIVHWGPVGERGRTEEITSTLFTGFRKRLQKLVDERIDQGYEEAEEECTLLIEYAVDDMGTSEDLARRHRLEDKLNELLGWIGLGHCDSGSIGSGTMEVCCLVVDFNMAKSAIEQNLKETEFGDYTRIFNEVLD